MTPTGHWLAVLARVLVRCPGLPNKPQWPEAVRAGTDVQEGTVSAEGDPSCLPHRALHDLTTPKFSS